MTDIGSLWVKNSFINGYVDRCCFLFLPGKTYTAMADGCITEFAIEELFDLIHLDVLHEYKVRYS